MGIFDFFKSKKKANQEEEATVIEDDSQKSPENLYSKKSINETYADEFNKTGLSQSMDIVESGPTEQFQIIYEYREYVVAFVSMMFKGNNSPIAAYQNIENNLVGYLYVAEDMSFNYTVPETLNMMEVEFEKRMSAGTILSYALFYHSEYNNDNNHEAINNYSRNSAITMKYKSAYLTYSFGLPYSIKDDTVIYRGFSFFSNEQNKNILSAQLDGSKDYFQERIEIKPETSENECGLKIKKVNNGSVGNMWSGIFGFERLQGAGRNTLTEYAAFTMSQTPGKNINDLIISDLKYFQVIFRFIQKKDKSFTTFFPVVTNFEFIGAENKLIAEWANVGGLEAVINGVGNDTFAINYFATDYAENKIIYHSNPKLNIALSGILLHLAVATTEEQKLDLDDYTVFSKDLTMYLPHKELGEFGVYDFIGILEDFFGIHLLENGSISGYMLKIRLINEHLGEESFSIQMFVNKDNSEIEDYQIGMKLEGIFQMQGAIIPSNNTN